MTSVSQSREIKQLIETGIDQLFDSVSSAGLSVSDAVQVLRETLNPAPGTIYTLSKKYLKRCFSIIGKENDGPTGNSTQEIKLARDNLFFCLFPDDMGTEIGVGIDNSGVENEIKQDLPVGIPNGLSLISVSFCFIS